MANRMTFPEHMQRAWNDTMMPLENEKQRKKRRFVHYFLGWPDVAFYDGSDIKGIALSAITFSTLYLLLMNFILPVYNLVRRPPELLFNLIAETFDYLKQLTQHSDYKIIRWLSLLPAIGHGLFKGAYFVFRMIISPIVSKSALDKLIDENVKDSSLKLRLIKVNSAVHAVILISELVAAIILKYLVFPPLALITFCAVLAYVDYINQPNIDAFGVYMWFLAPKKPASSLISEVSNDCTDKKAEEYDYGYEPEHYAPLFTASNDKPVVDIKEQHENEYTHAASIQDGYLIEYKIH